VGENSVDCGFFCASSATFCWKIYLKMASFVSGVAALAIGGYTQLEEMGEKSAQEAGKILEFIDSKYLLKIFELGNDFFKSDGFMGIIHDLYDIILNILTFIDFDSGCK
jgi:hypothetical protein